MPNKVYQAVIYARLSAENSGKITERDVIANQVEVCKAYMLENPQLDLIDVYVDNGQTNRIMEDVNRGILVSLGLSDWAKKRR
ncbi:hypothetical protein [Chakrabartyella piscis]|uniref:hypothetical protein n=1 Tax=Chakrabartyella piscis TaxID=2918914 RepID=UPI0029585F47|nr:hypothetical protein [Chakrabartyella piscis]